MRKDFGLSIPLPRRNNKGFLAIVTWLKLPQHGYIGFRVKDYYEKKTILLAVYPYYSILI